MSTPTFTGFYSLERQVARLEAREQRLRERIDRLVDERSDLRRQTELLRYQRTCAERRAWALSRVVPERSKLEKRVAELDARCKDKQRRILILTRQRDTWRERAKQTHEERLAHGREIYSERRSTPAGQEEVQPGA